MIKVNLVISAIDYYVNKTGSDSSDGMSPATAWRTISKVNSVFSRLQPSDKILFNRGDSFYGTVLISGSGSSGNYITVGSYGQGASPVITGFLDISGSWENYSKNVYRKAIKSNSRIRFLTINGRNYLPGRFPDSGRFLITASSTNFIEDNLNLKQDDNFWKGAEVSFRINRWEHKLREVNEYIKSSNRLKYNSGSAPPIGYGYFLQNHINCLMDNGDWCYSGGYIYLYYSNDPDSLNIKVSTLDIGVNTNTQSYINIIDLDFSGFNKSGVFINRSQFVNILNNIISTSVSGIINSNSDYSKIFANYVTYCGSKGILVENSNNVTISGNSVFEIGLDLGFSDGNNVGIALYQSRNSVCEKNDIFKTGYSGIHCYRIGNCVIEKNRIRAYCMTLDDGGGIYISD